MLSERTIAALGKIITGDPTKPSGPRVSPYRSGPFILRFFNEVAGFNDVYPNQGADSRWSMAEGRIRARNGDPSLVKIIEEALHPAYFRDSTEFPIESAVEYLNPYLKDDGQELIEQAGRYRLRSQLNGIVTMEKSFAGSQEVNHIFIDEQCAKCDRKLVEGDYTGAITNARSLVEAVFLEMERRLDPAPPRYEGELGKLYKRVRALLNLDPTGGETQPFHLVLVGMSNVIDGIAPMRNKMSDAHPLSYTPAKHHAKLAANAAKTIADFIFETYEYQVGLGKLTPVNQSQSNRSVP